MKKQINPTIKGREHTVVALEPAIRSQRFAVVYQRPVGQIINIVKPFVYEEPASRHQNARLCPATIKLVGFSAVGPLR